MFKGKTVLLLSTLSACLFASSSLFAQKLIVPQEIHHADKVYTLAFTAPQGRNSKRALYEYTTNGEAVEKWSSLITILYEGNSKTDPLDFSAALLKSLAATKPEPISSVTVENGHVLMRSVYEPDAANPVYESNVSKSFHGAAACGGLLQFQYAVKTPAGADQSAAGRQASLKLVNEGNASLAAQLRDSAWQPSCE
ncbi:hypothetical protein JAB5_11480 [Janthinobacterium sp. HH103]|uniref:hypothetical protein n=1 Tax=unclassified Janthinobacterium TaxID=2610881 RepID=UPI000892DF0F|nr:MULTISPECIES: hypothetical protein [unclassified Janthinobacterium]MCC7681504.1 hypothetical protein [Janthinobacterium sp. FW305-128]OEZ65151.1 hypothetical protein JAB2_35460 [Janthinobacterium sp. HH100]OEZ84351.1 hypothetical protein JAB5_11480 [Janthinobacterium sp. HH103]OEZ91674.1 hypothetical protein JAB8_12690 [Janthinobacterium sp. HH106]QOU70948.1 hypothetical protein JAB4_003410 [Janthinobacterium sp. HH102]